MIQKLSEPTSAASTPARRGTFSTRGLRAALWLLWTLAVIGGGAWGWRADTLAGRPLSVIGMAIDASLAGVIGLIVITFVEIRIEPWRFLE